MNSKPTIAIVDDDRAIREALEDLVHSCGYESRLFDSAEDFLSTSDRAEIDCMVVDVKMPGKSGIELQLELNKSPKRFPIIFLTSYRDERTREAAIAGGAFAFLSKPVDIDRLIVGLETALAGAL